MTKVKSSIDHFLRMVFSTKTKYFIFYKMRLIMLWNFFDNLFYPCLLSRTSIYCQ